MKPASRAIESIVIMGLSAFSVAASAQVAPAQYPPPPAYAPQGYSTQAAPPAPPPTIRQLFAGTLGAILASVQAPLMLGITQSVSGGITNWFAKKQAKMLGMPYLPPGSIANARSEPGAIDASGQTYDPSGAAPYDAGGYAPTTDYTTSYYNPSTGAAVTDAGTQYAPSAPGAAPVLYAGVAYEVHLLGPGGTSTAVDPSSHVFRTGDRFVVYYRPSMPGRMAVFNINPLGVESQIDDATMAAGQLSTLGPYQFANTKGDEKLRLVLTPCSTPALLTATRDIINVSATATGATGATDATGDSIATASEPTYAVAETAPGVSLQNCDAPMARSLKAAGARAKVRTRDIQKVANEGSTSFALDPVSTQEAQTGELTPREVTIRFAHQ